MRPIRTLLPVGLVAVLFVAACGSDSDSDTGTTVETSASSAPESSAASSSSAETEVTAETETTAETESTEAATTMSSAEAPTETTAGSAGSTEMTAPDASDLYTVTFDEEPTAGTLDAEAVGAASSTRSVTLANGDFESVAATALADPASASLDGMVTGSQQSVGGAEPVVETVSLNGWEGRKWSFTFDRAGTSGTYYSVGGVVEDTLLQVGYVDLGSDNQAEAEAFLASFQVLAPGPG